MSTKPKSRWHILTMFRGSDSPSTPPHSPYRWFGRRIPRHRIVFWTCALMLTTGVGVYLRAEIHRRASRFEDHPSANLVRSGGTLLIAGGGHLSEMIRNRFIELAGGRDARIVIIPAEATDADSQAHYRAAWSRYDVASVDVLAAESRTEADNPAVSRMLETATGVWLGGGQQTWLAGYYGRTLVESRLKEVLARNGVIGGTSAGAAVMSGVMIAGGRETPIMGRGFDLIPNAVIDQHFVKRNRIRRLQNVLEQHPEMIGFGIDEGTALQYGVESGRFQVLGQSCVVACVPRVESSHCTTFQLQFLNLGDEFDVKRLRSGDAVTPGFTDFEAVLLGD